MKGAEGVGEVHTKLFAELAVSLTVRMYKKNALHAHII